MVQHFLSPLHAMIFIGFSQIWNILIIIIPHNFKTIERVVLYLVMDCLITCMDENFIQEYWNKMKHCYYLVLRWIFRYDIGILMTMVWLLLWQGHVNNISKKSNIFKEHWSKHIGSQASFPFSSITFLFFLYFLFYFYFFYKYFSLG